MEPWSIVLERVTESVSYGFSIGTPNGKVVCYNRAMAVLSGYSKEEVNQIGWFDLLYPEPREREEAREKAIRCLKGQLGYAKGTITCKNGEKKEVFFLIKSTIIKHRKYNVGIMVDSLKSVQHLAETLSSVLEEIRKAVFQESVVSLEAYKMIDRLT